ncbi:4'-phosphopantetheinyl transferase [Micromonospora sp. NBC_01638]|uniref:4'-phosphopantetheinyl transferase family protein n=1 Tax=Micromonospora sp. NBC_01638 TaxID=2975982 RepID=UPI00386E697B
MPHTMTADLFPAGVVAVEAFDDAEPAPLFPEEERLIAGAGSKRRTEFATARRCAREALAGLGCPPAPVLPGEGGAPTWPAGVVGSITHCVGYRLVAVAPASTLWTLGVDAEPNEPLPPGLLGCVASAPERVAVTALLASDPSVRWDRLLFCAKEAVYKVWFPLTRQPLDFTGAVVTIDAAGRTFDARLTVPGPRLDGREVTGFTGRWLAHRGLLVAALATLVRDPATTRAG